MTQDRNISTSLYEELLSGRAKTAGVRSTLSRAVAAGNKQVISPEAMKYLRDAYIMGKLTTVGGVSALAGGPLIVKAVIPAAIAGGGLASLLAAATWPIDKARRLRVPKGGPLKWDGRPITFGSRSKAVTR